MSGTRFADFVMCIKSMDYARHTQTKKGHIHTQTPTLHIYTPPPELYILTVERFVQYSGAIGLPTDA